MNKSKAMEQIDHAINEFQKFVILTQEIYFKQDADRAVEIGSKLHQFKHLVEKVKTEDVVNEHR